MTPRLKTAIEDLRDCAMTDGNNNPLVPRALLLATENLLAAYDAEMSEKCPHGFTRKFDCIECVKEIVND